MLRHALAHRNAEVRSLARACTQALHTAGAAQLAHPEPSSSPSSTEQPWRQQVPPAAPAAHQQTALTVQPRQPQRLLERALSAVNTALNAVHRQAGRGTRQRLRKAAAVRRRTARFTSPPG